MKKYINITTFIIIFLTCFSGIMLVLNQDYYCDELPHSTQIFKILNKNYSLVKYLTVIPGYHIFVSVIIKMLLLPETLSTMRIVSCCFLTVYAYILFTKISDSNLRVLQLYFLPSLHIFYFLVYTDILSGLLVLNSFFNLKLKNYKISGILCSLSILVRQNNVIWVCGFLAYSIFNEIDFKNFVCLRKQELNKFFNLILTRYNTFVAGIITFIFFVIRNNGIVLGIDKVSHPVSFHFGNIWFFMFNITFLFFPVVFYTLFNKKHYNKTIFLFIFGIFLLVLGSSVNNHIYNQNNVFLKNKIINAAYSGIIPVIVYGLIVCIGVLYLSVLKFKKNTIWIILSGIIYLGVSWMIEYRYYTILFLLFTSYRKPVDNKNIEIMQTLYQIFLSLVMFFGIYSWKIFW